MSLSSLMMGLIIASTLLHGSVVRRRGLEGISGPRFSPWAATVPFKANQDRRHHIPKQRHRVTNWAVYDIALRQRGSLTVWFTEAAIAAWKAEPRTTRGGQPRYSALAITTALGHRPPLSRPRLTYKLRWLPSWCLVSLLGSRPEDRVPMRRGKTMAATLHRGDGYMAQKGRGIFMVYVDIDAQHVQEFNK